MIVGRDERTLGERDLTVEGSVTRNRGSAMKGLFGMGVDPHKLQQQDREGIE